MPPSKSLGQKQSSGSWFGNKIADFMSSLGQKSNYEYPADYKDRAKQATHVVGGAIRPLPSLSGSEQARAKQGMRDEMYSLQTGYNPDELAYGNDYTF